jgi:uncharacterized membrane protein YphA (DoxX/SURF4 family)
MDGKKFISLILTVGLALFFIVPNGLGKLLGIMGTDVEALAATFGYPVVFMKLIGALEILGGIGLLLQPVRKAAVLGLAGLMLGAVVSHIRAPDTMGMLPVPILTLVALFLVLKLNPGGSTDEGA